MGRSRELPREGTLEERLVREELCKGPGVAHRCSWGSIGSRGKTGCREALEALSGALAFTAVRWTTGPCSLSWCGGRHGRQGEIRAGFLEPLASR